jgi:hypothetical protein
MEQMEGVLGQRPLYLGGGLIENFKDGWALHGFGKAHYFKRGDFAFAHTLCGLTGYVRSLYGAGNWPRCAKCQRVFDKRREG